MLDVVMKLGIMLFMAGRPAPMETWHIRGDGE
jgi:hypothetical protein